ncbi:MAG: hypothetical protein PHU46_11635 [Rhodocyclaceae bacterium]|nr:hypothetical protein [Rhodocyclaceae bacterium]
MKRNKVAVIADADDPAKAEFLKGANGKRLLFGSPEEAEEWIAENGNRSVDYRLYDGTD